MITEIIVLAAIGLDKLAVCIGFGMAGMSRSRWVRVGLTFAFYGVLMLAIGLFAGESLSSRGATVAGYLSAFALIAVGGVSITSAIAAASAEAPPDGATATQAGSSVQITAFLISLDCLAVGIPLGLRNVRIGPTLVYFAVQTFVAAIIGLALGERVGTRLGDRAAVAAAVLLTGIGLLLLVTQVFDINLV